ncbi:MAG: hypothetical protein ACOC3W_01775 [Thermodesulfobacteriota bacterium]
MADKRRKSVSFNALVRMFLRDYNIPTKKDVDRLMARMDQLEQLIRTMALENRSPTASKGGGRGKNGSGITASDMVVEVIAQFPEGVSLSDIQNRTGFGEKKLRNIIYRLNKDGRIDRIRRGVYIVSEEGD